MSECRARWADHQAVNHPDGVLVRKRNLGTDLEPNHQLLRIFRHIKCLIGVIGGAGGIRTLDRALQPYNGLANRRLQPLGHSSVIDFTQLFLNLGLAKSLRVTSRATGEADPAGAPRSRVLLSAHRGHRKEPVSTFSDHALWCVGLVNFRPNREQSAGMLSIFTSSAYFCAMAPSLLASGQIARISRK